MHAKSRLARLTRFVSPLAIAAVMAAPLAAQADGTAPDAAKPDAPAAANPHVLIKTSMGDITLELFPKAAPKTVQNFVDLATGAREFEVQKGKKEKRPFFDGLTFHRVIDNFMIQGGCPLGTGMGSPGYSFEDEISAEALGLDKKKAFEGKRAHPWLLIRSQQDFQRTIVMPIFKKLGITTQEQLDKRRDEVQKAVDNAVETLTIKQVYENLGYKFTPKLPSVPPTRGTIAMANAGPNTNGSQFFICLVDPVHLTGKHTVFGKVVKGMDVVDKIGKVEVDGAAKPKMPVTIESVRLVAAPKPAADAAKEPAAPAAPTPPAKG